jgi:tetratricopeptide (TPR) repeat protein
VALAGQLQRIALKQVPMTTEYKYRAFISYSHSDERWASWLHKGLETYRVPKRLVGKDSPHGVVPARFAPIFRDRDELATATNLGETLTRALQQSQFQIVICSIAAAKSRWVNEEILAFKRLGRESRIFCLLVDGEPGSSQVPGLESMECFPQALLYILDADGNLTKTRSEPIAADVRPNKDGKSDALLKLLAGMLGVGLDELKQREAQRRRTRLTWLLTGTTIGMIVTSTLATTAWLARNEAQRQRERALAEAETARQTTRFMVDLFKVSDPSEALGNKITAREILDKGAARINTELTDQPAIQATLMDTMGSVYTSLGLYGAAVPLMQQALQKRRTLFGPQHQDVAQSLNNLGEALTRTSNYTEAERDLNQALVIRRQLLGNNSADVAVTLSSLAEVLAARGEYAQGQPLIEEALAIRRRLYGDVHPLVAKSMSDLGQNFSDRGDFKQAEVYLRQAMEMQRKLHPKGHPALAESISNVALALMSQEKPAEAEALYEESVAMLRKLLGNAHPDLATALQNLGLARETRHNYRGAEAAYLEALQMSRKMLGERHPDVATIMGNMAFVIYADGRRKQAIELQRAALAMRRELLGNEHPSVASSEANLAYWLTDAREFAEAGQLVNASLATRRRMLGNDHPTVATTLTVRANLLVAQGKYDAALTDALEAEKILAPDYDASQWRMAMATNVHGAALTGLRRFPEAEELLLKSLGGLSASPMQGAADKGRQRLATLYSTWGKPERAAQYLPR